MKTYLAVLVFLMVSKHQLISQKYQFSLPKLGSYFRIVISTDDTVRLHDAITQSYIIVDDLDVIFSDYKDDSECSSISRAKSNQWIKVSDSMYEVLEESLTACKKSKGQFNVTIGKVTAVWRNEKENLERIRKIDSLISCVKCDNFKLDPETKSLFKTRDCYAFDFGGIAKGYISQKVSDYLKSRGFKNHLIDAGGDLLLGEPPTGQKGWKIKIEDREKTYTLKNIAIATSGKTYQQYENETLYETHIINPVADNKNNQNHKKAVTVMCKSAIKADWMATWRYMYFSNKTLYKE